MPYPLDLVRLATSAVLGDSKAGGRDDICVRLLKGYAQGLANPHPTVLERDDAWLRQLVVVDERERARFWQKMDALTPGRTPAPARYLKALAAAMPDRGIEPAVRPRTAGVGSLGRPRWVGIGQWRGALVVREAKAMVPSAWTLAHGRGRGTLQCLRIAAGRYRSPDPWLALTGDIATRRLSPNNRKIEAAESPFILTSRKMLHAMGRDLAAIHLGTADRSKAIEHDLGSRKRNWLRSAVERAADFVRRDCRAWRNQ